MTMSWREAKTMQFKVLDGVAKKFQTAVEKTKEEVEFNGQPLSQMAFVNAVFLWIGELDGWHLRDFIIPKIRDLEAHMREEE
jgi:hypothetical protein